MPDPEADAYARGLRRMNPFDATFAAATAAACPDRHVRFVLAQALAHPFPLVGDVLVLEHLTRDPDDDVRIAALHASATRFHRR